MSFETIQTTDSIATLRTKVNGNFDLLKVDHAGASEPTVTWAYQLWADTSNGVLKQRDSGDTTWTVLGPLNRRWDWREGSRDMDGLSASVNVPIWTPPEIAYVLELAIMSDTATSGSSGSHRYEFQLRNKTTSVNLFATAQYTSTTELVAGTAPVVFTPDQNRNVAKNDYLELQITKTGTPTSLASAKLRFTLRGYMRGA